MRPVSAGFLRTVRGSHVMRARARVVAPGQTGTNPTGTVIPILDGDVTSEAKIYGGQKVTGAAIISTLDLETDGTGMWPRRASDALAPFGNEIYVERGIAFGNGVIEYVGLGYFRIDTPEQDEPPDGPIRISASDRMSGLIDGKLTAPRQFTASTTLGTVVSTLVTEVYPGATIEWDDAANLSTLGRTLIAEEDRFEFIADLLTAAGKMFYWDYRGVFVIQAGPDGSAAPVYDVSAGEDGVLVSMARDISRQGVYNGVVATGEGADTKPPVRAVVVDNDPDSPTYWGGAFGKVPRFYSSPFITTTSQATTAGTAILRQSLGVPYNVSFGTVPNPALEPLDSVTVSYPRSSRSRGTRTETHLIEKLTIPLTAQGEMKAQTREQTLAVIAGA